MNQNGTVRNLFVMTLATAAGGLMGYLMAELIVDKIYNKQFEDEDDSEMNPPYEPDERTSKVMDDNIEGIEKDRIIRGRRTNYASLAKPDLETLVGPYKISDKTPRIISLDDWSNVHPMNDKQTITFYEGDLTYADANDEIIPNPQDVLGPNIHLHFGEQSDDPDIVYVRADFRSTDYEIVRVAGTYQEIVMGVIPEEKKPIAKKRRAPRKKIVEDESEDDSEE